MLLGPKPQLNLALERIHESAVDVLVLGGVDFDARHYGVALLKDHLSRLGLDLPFHVAPMPNTARYMADGRQIGFGLFPGAKGLVVLSKWPVALRTKFDDRAWQDVSNPLALADELDMPLVSRNQYIVEVAHPQGPIVLGAGHMVPPISRQGTDQNIRRNHAELMLWNDILEEGREMDMLAILANNDPQRGDGLKPALQQLIQNPRWHNFVPQGCLPAGECGEFTAHWPDPGPGKLRSDYILLRREVPLIEHELIWGSEHTNESRHALVKMRFAWP